MRKSLLIMLSLVAFSFVATAQLNSCVPNPQYKDSLFGVFPKPYDPIVNPKGGINQSACIGKPFKFVFTGIIPDTLAVPLFGQLVKLKVDSLVLDKKDLKTIEGLPSGLKWDCSGGKCKFLPKSQSCIVIYGTADNTNAAKDYELKIKIKAYFQTFLGPTVYDLTFPDANLAPGKYILKLEPNASKTCYAVGNEDQYLNVDKIVAFPNPTLSDAKITFSAKESDDFDFLVTDMNGRIVQRKSVKVTEGWNEILFNGGSLPEGVYIYSLGNAKGKISNRIVIER
jgi:hypothetical protein